jgi:hypothetical protein
VDIAGDVAPAVQLRRYAWSARLPLSVLTDFEEFAIYDCRSEPEKNDSAPTARLELFTYDRYAEPEVWERISSVFSREAVLDGSLERYAEENRKRRGKETVDAAFLREIEDWRSTLARNIAARNDLNTRALNFAVQMTILKVLEGESEASLATQLRMFQGRALPDLDENIKCGNSLIGPDFYDNEQMMLLDEEHVVAFAMSLALGENALTHGRGKHHQGRVAGGVGDHRDAPPGDAHAGRGARCNRGSSGLPHRRSARA